MTLKSEGEQVGQYHYPIEHHTSDFSQFKKTRKLVTRIQMDKIKLVMFSKMQLFRKSKKSRLIVLEIIRGIAKIWYQ